jgi:hypothetical protein
MNMLHIEDAETHFFVTTLNLTTDYTYYCQYCTDKCRVTFSFFVKAQENSSVSSLFLPKCGRKSVAIYQHISHYNATTQFQ